MTRSLARLCGTALVLVSASCAMAQGQPVAPHIDSVVMAAKQPQANGASIIWYDDFDAPSWQRYAEKSGELTRAQTFGGKGGSLESTFPKGQKGGGTAGCKVWFGDCPLNYGAAASKVVRAGEKFDEVFMRVYVKHERGWEGGYPAKLVRATSLVNNNFAQAMIAHAWGAGDSDCVTLDPVSCVKDGKVMSTKYNDWNGMKWLGNSPAGVFPLSKADWWVAVEMRVKLNTPGQKDGECQLWIDGRLDCERKHLDWRGTYTDHTINSVMLESYWNKGAPKDLHRWFDNFVVSSQRIGPVVCAANPTLIKTQYEGPGQQAAWAVELAADADGQQVVFRSKDIADGDQVTVSSTTGQFSGALAGKGSLASGKTYYCRARQKNDAGQWSDWSTWHQQFQVQ